MAKDIGEENGPLASEDHPSNHAIKANISSAEPDFHFKPVVEAKVTGYLGRVGPGKSTGLDTMGPTTSLVNRMLTDRRFPASLKEARVSPVFKKKDTFDVQNYRHISMLPITSKIFERALEE